jgi:hypothetical protein
MTSKTIIRVLRGTAKVLLVAAPLVLATGFLSAKPYLLPGLELGTFRRAHTVLAPLIFIPIFYVHSLAGIRYLLSRSKKLDRPAIRIWATVLWSAVVLGVSAMYFARPPGVRMGRPAIAISTNPTEDVEPPPAAQGPRYLDGGTSRDSDPERGESEAAESDVPARKGKARQPSGRGRSVKISKTQSQPPGEIADAGARGGEEPRVTPAPSGSKLVRKRCVGCHGLDKVYEKRRSAADWRRVVVRMEAMGVALDDAERRAVIRHLSNR